MKSTKIFLKQKKKTKRANMLVSDIETFSQEEEEEEEKKRPYGRDRNKNLLEDEYRKFFLECKK